MNGRIGYIDSLKGLSMLMVVVGHIIIFCTLNYDNEFVRHIVLINMPLFFFLNGLVVKRLQKGGGNLWRTIWKKARSILIPFFAWGILISLFRGETYIEFLLSYFKFGYWYLPVLFQLCMVKCICDIVLNYIPQKNILIETILLFVLVWVFFRFCTRFIPADINIIIDYYQVIEYMPYFFLGIFVSRFALVENIKRYPSSWVSIIFLLSIVCYVWWSYNSDGLITFILRTSLILLIYTLFFIYDNNKKGATSFFNLVLATIGRHTLAIYMIQYFLFRYINLHAIGESLYDSNNQLALLIFVIIVSLVVCYICIGVEKVIATSKLFSFILLGKPYINP